MNPNTMQKVIVIGCCGAGKSTFAKRLHELIGLELIHLDQHYWQADWAETEEMEWRKKVEDLASKPSWIIDGNYGGTMDIRLKKADTIIYLDYSTLSCLSRITKRIMKYRGTVRPDMPEGCRERFDLEFYHYVATYNLLRRKKHYRQIEENKANKQTIILKNDRQQEQFFESLKSKLNLQENH